LRYWLSTQTEIRETTRFNYTRDVESFLIPHLGKICMADLDYDRLKDGFDRIAADTGIAPSSLQHLRSTLRTALSHAVREGVLTSNPARKLRIPGGPKPVAQVWTPRRVQQWRQTGERPAVAVWTVGHLAAFLTTVLGDRFFALWWLVALRGLRRGEAAGLRWEDIDFKHRQLYIRRNRSTAGHRVVEGPPKTSAGLRVIALDRHTIAILKTHLRRQLEQRAARIAAGNDWYESGYVFLRPDGRPVHPGYLTRRFGELVKRADVPPVRLHDLRHGAASLAHETGADLKTEQDLLGHSSIVTTADTYTSVLPHDHHKAAQAAAQAVLQADRRTRQKIKDRARHSRPRPIPETGAPTPTRPAEPRKRRSKGRRKNRGHAQR
jgi:integrase